MSAPVRPDKLDRIEQSANLATIRDREVVVAAPIALALVRVARAARRADEIAAADRAEEANQFFAASLCYSGTPGGRFGGFDGSGVHLTLNGRTTLCGRPVLDEPTVPRTIGPLSCEACYEADHAR